MTSSLLQLAKSPVHPPSAGSNEGFHVSDSPHKVAPSSSDDAGTIAPQSPPVYFINGIYVIDWTRKGTVKIVPLDDYFGYPILNGHPVPGNGLEVEPLPPYLEEPPAYTSSGMIEPMTFAKYLFQFGFCESILLFLSF
jgi:hypothetical protein